MPGIAGLISSDPFAAKYLERMTSCLVHEPAYASGTYRHAVLGVHVGWAVHSGSFADCMPIWNEAQDVCMFLCGEVFADAADLHELTRRGHRFGLGDASHLVHLYEEHGQDFVEQLNGWFSGLIIDLRRSTATLFNDRYGVGRIYLRETDRGLYFSSEAKSLLRIFPESRRLAIAAVAETLSFGCVMQNRTLYSGITLLPPASIWTVSCDATIQKRSYFDPHTWARQDPLADDQFCQALEQTFAEQLPLYFRGPGAAAMSLTGGLDGRMIMAWAHNTPGSLPCYSFGSSYRDCQDVTLASAVARACGQPHRTIVAGPELLADFPALAARCVYLSDGTMDVSGAVELYVNRIARGIAPVRLTGNYGSEIVRGNVAFRPRRLDASLFEPEFEPHLEAAAQTYRAEREIRDLTFVAFKQVPWHHHARLSVEQSQLTVRSPFLDNRLVALMYRASPAMLHSKLPSLRLIHSGNPTLARIPTDRGLQYDAPTLAGKLRTTMLEFTAKAEYAYDYGMPQWLAKADHALSALQLERLFLGRHKFYHFRSWYRHQLAAYVQELLLDRSVLERSCYKPRVLERFVREHISGRGNHTLEIHRALTLELTHRQLLERWVGEEATE